MARRTFDDEVISAYGIKYRRIQHLDYKYELAEPYGYPYAIEIRPEASIDHPYMALTTDAKLTVKARYAWDGASGPARDTPNIMRGSLVHDALYQMMRERLLDHERYREAADRLLRNICREDGMSGMRAWWVYWGVRVGGGCAARRRDA